MNNFVSQFQRVIKGIISGFDRIVFKGTILPLVRESGAMSFCQAKNILNRDFKQWAIGHSRRLVDSAEQYAKNNCGVGIEPISSSKIRKEKLAHRRQQESGIQSGLIGVWSALESCWSYKSRYSEKAGFPQLRGEWTKCKHLYYYFDHPQYGFMNVRLQTWFPYHIQIALNGREWLRRDLETAGIAHLCRDNKFVHLADFDFAQRLLDYQLDAKWDSLLEGFLPDVFPIKESILGPHLNYYWSLWQSEWATDFIFQSPKDLAPHMDSLLKHAWNTGTGDRVLRYLDRPLNKNGQPRVNMPHDVVSRLLSFNDGLRVRHWVDNNSVKCDNELNVLRVETTMNQPKMFKVYRHAQGQSPNEPKSLRPLRKGIADIVLRSQVSQDINNRFIDNLSAAKQQTPMSELLSDVVKPFTKNGRRIRALDPTGKDRSLLQAINDPAFIVSGITNKKLRAKLNSQSGYNRMNDKQLSAKMSRQLRLLRDHGLIRKLPRQNRYRITQKGQELSMALQAILNTSTEQLLKAAA